MWSRGESGDTEVGQQHRNRLRGHRGAAVVRGGSAGHRRRAVWQWSWRVTAWPTQGVWPGWFTTLQHDNPMKAYLDAALILIAAHRDSGVMGGLIAYPPISVAQQVPRRQRLDNRAFEAGSRNRAACLARFDLASVPAHRVCSRQRGPARVGRPYTGSLRCSSLIAPPELPCIRSAHEPVSRIRRHGLR